MTITPPGRALHPRHGIHEPTSGTPLRRPGSIRRTSTVDMLRPDGLGGPLVLAGHGRDLLTPGSGAARTVAKATSRAVVDFTGGRILRELGTDPARPLGSLIGGRAGSGFRRRLDAADPALSEEHDLLYLLLDDLPVTTLVSGHAVAAGLAASGHTPDVRPGKRERALGVQGRPAFTVGLCAGFAAGGTIMEGIARDGMPPVVTGPAAGSLDRGGDPDAWHERAPLPPHAMRRARRIDVLPDDPAAPGERAVIDAFFRDSYVLPDGLETVVHEYTLTARISGGTLSHCEARARVLPWLECPGAVASATRLAGVPLSGLRDHVRETFGGTTTCTHLNDMLRALEDVPALLERTARTWQALPEPDDNDPRAGGTP